MPRLLLVRHATSVPPTRHGPNESERPLAARGVQQAEALAGVLTTQRPLRVFSSPYRRAVQTVAPAAAALGLPVETRPDCSEWRSGLAPTAAWRPHYRRCWEHPGWSLPGGETHQALQERAVAAVWQVAAELPAEATAVVASHGTWIARALNGLGCAVDVDFWLDMPMPAVFALDLRGAAPGVQAVDLGPE